MVIAMLLAVAVTGAIAALLVMHGTAPEDKVSTRWLDARVRERRDDL
jgi:hypothetical protein